MPQAVTAIIGGVISAFGSYASSNKAAKRARQSTAEAIAYQKKADEANRALFEKYATPSTEAVSAAGTQTRGTLGQARLGAYQNLSRNLASRGFGSGSGLGVEGAANIEGAYLKSLGQAQTDLTKYANTPQISPSGAYSTTSYPGVSVPSGSEAMLGGASNMLNTALGMYMANQMLNKGSGGNSGWGIGSSPFLTSLFYGSPKMYSDPSYMTPITSEPSYAYRGYGF